MDKHTAYFNILGALPQSGCAVCRLGHEAEVKYIRNLLYSKTTTVSTRAELRRARGFCLYHARQLDEIGHALDVSIIYQDILMTVRDLLQKPSPRQVTMWGRRRQLSQALAPEQDCPACLHRAELEVIYLETLLDHLVDPEFVSKVRASSPLCLAHLRRAIEIVPSAAQFQTLREVQLAHWEPLIAELGEFVRKNDHRFQDLEIGEERDAWIRAVDAITGTRHF